MSRAICDDFIRRLKDVVPHGGALHEPSLTNVEEQYVLDGLRSGFVSTSGLQITEFEKVFAKFVGANYAIAVVNGTAGLHLALIEAGVKTGDEVLIPGLSFVATANAVLYQQAIPVFLDVDLTSFGLNPELVRAWLGKNTRSRSDGSLYNLKTGRKVTALIAVHVLGMPSDIVALQNICDEFGLNLIEDAAEGLGSQVAEVSVGLFGRSGCFSFNGNKIITTGGGGMVVTNKEEIATRIRHLSATAKVQHPWEYRHTALGYNYRMPNINASLGLAQMTRISDIATKKRRLFELYDQSFADSDYGSIVKQSLGIVWNHWLNAFILSEQDAFLIHSLIRESHVHGFAVRPLWTVLADLPHLKSFPRDDLINCRALCQRVICLPSGPNLANE